MGTIIYYLFMACVCFLAAFLILHKNTKTLSNKEIDDVISKLQRVKRTKRANDPQYSYFVTFETQKSKARCEMKTFLPISSIRDIFELEKTLSVDNDTQCLITNYQLLKEPSDQYKDNLIANMRDIIMEWHQIINAPKRHDKTKLDLLRKSENKVVDILKDINTN